MTENDHSEVQKLSVDRLSVKLPPFWPEKPEIWFWQAESQFEISGITNEKTKLSYLIAQLDVKLVENSWDLLSLPDENKYTKAKTASTRNI